MLRNRVLLLKGCISYSLAISNGLVKRKKPVRSPVAHMRLCWLWRLLITMPSKSQGITPYISQSPTAKHLRFWHSLDSWRSSSFINRNVQSQDTQKHIILKIVVCTSIVIFAVSFSRFAFHNCSRFSRTECLPSVVVFNLLLRYVYSITNMYIALVSKPYSWQLYRYIMS